SSSIVFGEAELVSILLENDILTVAVRTHAVVVFFFSSRRRHTRSVSAFLLNRSSDLADASSAGMVDAGFENQKELTKMQLDNQKEIAEMQNETQKEIAGIQSATSRQNTKDQVYAQNEMLAYQQKESTAR